MRMPDPDLGLKSVVANLAEAMMNASSTLRADELRARELAEELRIANMQKQEEAWTASQTIHQINQSASLQIGKSSQKVIEVEEQAKRIISDQAEIAHAEMMKTEDIERQASQYVTQIAQESNLKNTEIEELK
jgi:hypothetical protein